MGREVAVRKNTLPANFEEQLRKDAAAAKDAESGVGVGQFMSTRAGQLSFQGTPLPGNKMRCVILDSILVNTYYAGEFDANNPSSPVCFAFGRKEEGMAPHEQSSDPQWKDCASCAHNKFGSAEQGRGKACKNGRRLGLIHVDSLKGDLKDAQVAFLPLPPTSLPSWATYVRSLQTQIERPPYAVVTEIAVVPDPKSQFKVTFTLISEIKDKKLLGAVYAKAKEVSEGIDFPYQPMDGAAKPGRKARAAAAPRRPAPKKPAPTPKAAPRVARAGGGGFGGGAAKPQKF